MLNTSLIGTHKTFADYGALQFDRFIVPQWIRGSTEVHVIFDNPGRIQSHLNNSKEIDVMTMPQCFRITCVLK